MTEPEEIALSIYPFYDGKQEVREYVIGSLYGATQTIIDQVVEALNALIKEDS